MDAAMIKKIPMMNVAVNIGLHLAARDKEFPQLLGIFQATGEMFFVTTEARIVMGKDQGGFVGMGIQDFREPCELLVPQQTLRHQAGFEGIDKKQIGFGRRHHANML